MLVASMALTPLASSVVLQPNEVSAAQEYNSLDDLINKLEQIYTNDNILNDTERGNIKTAVSAVYSEFNSLSDREWDSIVSNIIVDGKESDDVKDLAKDMILILNALTLEDLNDKISEFRSKYNDDSIKDILDNPNVSEDSVLNYFAAVELEFLKELGKVEDISDLSSIDYYYSLYTAFKNAGDDYPNEYVAFTGMFDFNISALIDLKASLDQVDVGVKGAALSAIHKIATALKVEPPVVTPPVVTPPDSSGGGGGGGSTAPTTPTPPTTPPTPAPGQVGQTPDSITKDPAKVVEAIKEAKDFTKLVIGGTGAAAAVDVPQSVLKAVAEKNPAAVVEVKIDKGSYALPVSEINLDNLAKELGVEAKDVKISINVTVTTDTAKVIETNGLKAVAPVLEFEVTAKGAGDKTVSIVKTKFNGYVDRTIVGEKDFNANQSTGVRLNNDGTFASLPTYFDGKTATIKSLTNSKYTVVENSKTFKDVDGGANWAEAHIEKLASKYVISGKTQDNYAPNDFMTRGEFAALISRSLGLVAQDASAVKFSDVSTTQALNKNGEIAAAVEAGIIFGKKDGRFYPYDRITRAEAAMMISRAMDYAKASDNDLDKSKKLADLEDLKQIGATSRASVEKVIQAGVMSGYSNGNFGPNDNTKRDQMATILDKFLQFIKFSN